MKKITPAEYEQWLAENRPEITALEPYTRNHDKIMHRHDCGNEWAVAPSNVKGGKGCPKCSGTHRPSPEDYEQWLLDDGRGIIALGPYVKAHQKLTHQCHKGHKWQAEPTKIKGGAGCPTCYQERTGKVANGYWTDERLMQSALRFTTPREWLNGCSSSYYAAHRKGLLEQCTAHMERTQMAPGYWINNPDRCIKEARKYNTPSEWHRDAAGSYQAALQNGSYEAATSHMVCGRMLHADKVRKHTKKICISIASGYQTISDWQRGHDGSYKAAWRKGWLADCTGHMERVSGHDNDAVYVYEIRDDLGWTGIYKVGLTSWKREDLRIRQTNAANDTEYRVLFLLRTTAGDAKKIEQAILGSGTPFTDLPDSFVDGTTEFRKFGPRAMDTIKQMAAMYSPKEAA